MLWSLTLPAASGQLLAAREVWETFPRSACAWPVDQAGTLGVKAAHQKYRWLTVVAQSGEYLKVP